jgi:hypothetical protein
MQTATGPLTDDLGLLPKTWALVAKLFKFVSSVRRGLRHRWQTRPVDNTADTEGMRKRAIVPS